MESVRLLFGTGNPAKFDTMKKRLEILPVALISLREMTFVPQVEEDGKDPLENARIKARVYWEAYHMPVFSCDSGLFIKELSEDLQPGVHVRRRGEKAMTDEEMTDYYAGLARQYGRLTCRYQNAISLILDEEHQYESVDESLFGNWFYLTDKPHPKKVEGFPLDRISLTIPSGKYYYDSRDTKTDSKKIDRAFCRFFQQSLGDWKRSETGG